MMMRWMMGLALGVMCVATAGAQNVTQMGHAKDDLFAGTEMFAKNAASATEINMGPHSLDMVGGDDGDHAHRMLLNVVRTYTYDKPGMYNMADVDVYRKKLETGDWHCSVHTWDMKTGSSTDICEKQRTDGLRESAIITVSPKSLTFIHTIRKADKGDSELVIPGMYGLDGLPGLAIMDTPAFAEMQANMAAMQVQLAQMDLPKLKDLDLKLKDMKLKELPRIRLMLPAPPVAPAAPVAPVPAPAPAPAPQP
jgi:hypothetical protein